MYKKPLLEKILKGEKTQTRRPIDRKPGRRVYSIGEKVGIRAGYTKYVAYIIIKKRRKQRLGDITEKDAKKEGLNSLEEFQKVWTSLYGWKPDQVVWVYDFELAKTDSPSKDKPFPLAANPSTPQ